VIAPYAGDKAPVSAPVATLALIGVSFAVFGTVAVTTIVGGPSAPVRWFAATALAPGSLRWYTPLTYWLLHEHLLHVSSNMLFVFVFGSAVEGSLGPRRLALLFLSAAVVTGLAEAGAAAYGPATDAGVMIVGGSGAAAGLLGAFAALFRASRLHLGIAPWSARALPVILLMAVGEVATVGWRALSSHAFAPPTAANWAHIVGFLYGIAWVRLVERRRLGHPHGSGLPDATADEPSPFADAVRWERALEANPHDVRALVGLPVALAQAGDAERAAERAAFAVSEALGRGDGPAAAARFAALHGLEPHRSMPDEAALEAAGALAELGRPKLALEVYDHVAQRTSAEAIRARAGIRAAACLIRRLGMPREGAERLRGMLAGAGDAEWRAYAVRLLKEAETADTCERR